MRAVPESAYQLSATELVHARLVCICCHFPPCSQATLASFPLSRLCPNVDKLPGGGDDSWPLLCCSPA